MPHRCLGFCYAINAAYAELAEYGSTVFGRSLFCNLLPCCAVVFWAFQRKHGSGKRVSVCVLLADCYWTCLSCVVNVKAQFFSGSYDEGAPCGVHNVQAGRGNLLKEILPGRDVCKNDCAGAVSYCSGNLVSGRATVAEVYASYGLAGLSVIFADNQLPVLWLVRETYL